jgi:hypothetical protein
VARPISDEQFASAPFTDENAIRVRQEAELFRDVMASQGWSVVSQTWERRRQVLRREQFKATPERLHEIQQELRALDIPLRVIQDTAVAAERAGQWQRAQKQAQEQAQPVPPMPLSIAGLGQAQAKKFAGPAEAEAAITVSRAIGKMADMPGWKVLLRKLAATSHGAHMLLEWCRPEDAHTLQAMIDALYAPIATLQRLLDRGDAAVAFFDELQKEQEKEESRHA